jgi:hypothetical protein
VNVSLYNQPRRFLKLKQESRLINPGSGAVVIGRDEGAKLCEYPPAMTLWH